MEQVSLVTACKNREPNLLRVIESWLLTDCAEIVIVDWSCDKPLFETFQNAGVRDKRIRMLRVVNEPRWILTHAFNVGLMRSQGDSIIKLDNDHAITKNFLVANALTENVDARLGSWRLARDASQAYINGAFYARRKVLHNVGYFNELITTYGWDDTYLHESIFASGAAIAYLDAATIQHIEQDEESRTSNQSVSLEDKLATSLEKKATEFMNRRNMYLTAVLPRQFSSTDHSRYETVSNRHEHGLDITVLRRLSNPTIQLDQSYIKLANLLAYRDFYAWKHGLKPVSIALSEVHKLHEALEPLIKADNLNFGIKQPASVQCKLKPLMAISEKRAQRASRDISLPKKLTDVVWRLLPAACSFYGHTSNEHRYQINIDQLGLDENDEHTLNGFLPDWFASKVSFRLKQDTDDRNTKIVKPWKSAEILVESTVFKRRENQYYWASMNSLEPPLKRSLYELIEKGGRPNDLILSCTVQALLRGDISEHEMSRRLKPLGMIFPSRSEAAFRAWCQSRVMAIKNFAGAEIADLVQSTLLANPRVDEANLTLATALFKGSRHIIGYALNIRRMHLFERTDVVISIAPSPESKSQELYLKEHFSDAPNVTVSHMETDPGLYECWNNTIRNAKSAYVGNANIDERRGRYHSDYLIYLMEYENLDGAASALVADTSDTHNRFSASQDIWFLGMGRDVTTNDLILEDEDSVRSQNMMHCMPIWRAMLQKDIGTFDEDQFGTSADWEYWLRAVQAGKKLRIMDIPLGFYLIDVASHNRRDPESRILKERKILEKHASASLRRKRIIIN